MVNKLRKRNAINRKKVLVFLLVLIAMFGINVGYSYLETMLLINANVEIDPYLRAKVDTEILGVPMTAYLDDRVSPYVTSSDGIDFYSKSSDTNGKGLYLGKGTENDPNPIFYYRGDIDDNNVVFGDYCWKIIRTTETGGTKLLYNGYKYDYIPIEQSSYTNISNDPTYPFTFDTDTGRWISNNHVKGSSSKITFSVKEAGNYILDFYTSASIDSTSLADADMGCYQLSNSGTRKCHMGVSNNILELNNLTPDITIDISFSKNSSSSEYDDNIKFAIKKYSDVINCDNSGADAQIGTSSFSDKNTSPTYVGYMRGANETTDNTDYEYSTFELNDAYLYGTDISWSNGNYTLQNTQTGVDDNHHYTCISSEKSCSQVAFVYYVNDSNEVYYLLLKNGESIEEAKSTMFENRFDSNVKKMIDDWYSNNLISYASMIEDTVYCNSRKFYSNDFHSKSSILNTADFRRKVYAKSEDQCPNQSDRFTVSDTVNGNGMLTNPIGLITKSEATYAGIIGNDENLNSYIVSKSDYWTMSPYSFGFIDSANKYDSYSRVTKVGSDGERYTSKTSSTSGVRPVISLKKGVKVSSGQGTVNNPYIVS